MLKDLALDSWICWRKPLKLMLLDSLAEDEENKVYVKRRM